MRKMNEKSGNEEMMCAKLDKANDHVRSLECDLITQK